MNSKPQVLLAITNTMVRLTSVAIVLASLVSALATPIDVSQNVTERAALSNTGRVRAHQLLPDDHIANIVLGNLVLRRTWCLWLQ